MSFPERMQDVLEWLRGFRRAAAASVLEAGRPAGWMDFKDVAEVAVPDFRGLADLFDVSDSEDAYAKLRSDPEATAGAVMAAKLGADWLSGLGRDYRARRRSPIRSFVHAAARASADSDPQGPLTLHSQGWLERLAASDSSGRGG